MSNKVVRINGLDINIEELTKIVINELNKQLNVTPTPVNTPTMTSTVIPPSIPARPTIVIYNSSEPVYIQYTKQYIHALFCKTFGMTNVNSFYRFMQSYEIGIAGSTLISAMQQAMEYYNSQLSNFQNKNPAYVFPTKENVKTYENSDFDFFIGSAVQNNYNGFIENLKKLNISDTWGKSIDKGVWSSKDYFGYTYYGSSTIRRIFEMTYNKQKMQFIFVTDIQQNYKTFDIVECATLLTIENFKFELKINPTTFANIGKGKLQLNTNYRNMFQTTKEKQQRMLERLTKYSKRGFKFIGFMCLRCINVDNKSNLTELIEQYSKLMKLLDYDNLMIKYHIND